MPRITVEFYGVPRHRAGRPELTVHADTPRAALAAVAAACPGLADALTDGELAKHYLLSLNGDRFLTDLDAELASGTVLLLLSADAGG
jgi:molybdopterin converting factor small subunit